MIILFITGEKHKFLHKLKIQELKGKLIKIFMSKYFNKKDYILINNKYIITILHQF